MLIFGRFLTFYLEIVIYEFMADMVTRSLTQPNLRKKLEIINSELIEIFNGNGGPDGNVIYGVVRK